MSDIIAWDDGRLFMELRPGEEWLAASFWEAGGARERRAVLWDVPLARRKAAWLSVISGSPHCVAAWLFDMPLALAWTIPLAPNSPSAQIHFYFTIKSHRALQAGMMALHMLANAYDLLASIIPDKWHGARTFAQKLGFTEAAKLPKACLITEHNRLVNGTLLIKDLRPGKTVWGGKSFCGEGPFFESA